MRLRAKISQVLDSPRRKNGPALAELAIQPIGDRGKRGCCGQVTFTAEAFSTRSLELFGGGPSHDQVGAKWLQHREGAAYLASLVADADSGRSEHPVVDVAQLPQGTLPFTSVCRAGTAVYTDMFAHDDPTGKVTTDSLCRVFIIRPSSPLCWFPAARRPVADGNVRRRGRPRRCRARRAARFGCDRSERRPLRA